MNNELTNGAIESFLSPINPRFWGVFSIDQLSPLIAKAQHANAFSIIVNLSPSTMKGSHFVTILCKNHHSIYYLDSLALPPQFHSLIWEFIQGCHRKTLHQLGSPIQSATSSACGYFCIFFVLYFSHLKNPPTSLSFLTFPSLENDTICKCLIHNLIKKH